MYVRKPYCAVCSSKWGNCEHSKNGPPDILRCRECGYRRPVETVGGYIFCSNCVQMYLKKFAIR